MSIKIALQGMLEYFCTEAVRYSKWAVLKYLKVFTHQEEKSYDAANALNMWVVPNTTEIYIHYYTKKRPSIEVTFWKRGNENYFFSDLEKNMSVKHNSKTK